MWTSDWAVSPCTLGPVQGGMGAIRLPVLLKVPHTTGCIVVSIGWSQYCFILQRCVSFKDIYFNDQETEAARNEICSFLQMHAAGPAGTNQPQTASSGHSDTVASASWRGVFRRHTIIYNCHPKMIRTRPCMSRN